MVLTRIFKNGIFSNCLWKIGEKKAPTPVFAQSAPLCSSNSNSVSASDYKLVIFDKDGTIIEFGVGWTDWTIRLTKAMEKDTGLQLGNKLLHLFGYDTKAEKWREGLMCDNPALILTELSRFLQSEGLTPVKAERTIKNTFRDDHTTDPSHIKAIDNPTAIFQMLKHYGIHRALCTSDSVYSTNQSMEKLRLTQLCEFQFCGDQEGFMPKPKPDNIHTICKAFGVSPSETVMIGDTRRDMEMGRAAGAGLCVGVTSGVCQPEELTSLADVVVPSILDSCGYYLPEGWEEVYEQYDK